MSMGWGIAGGVVLATVFALAGPWIIDLMTTAPDVRIEARHFLIWVVAAPVIGVFAWIYDGIFIGATLTAQMRRTMLLSACIYAMALVILVPIFAPVVSAAGLDPVLVGTIITLQVAIGSATPPFGCDIFTAIAVFKRPYAEVIRGTPPCVFMLRSVAVALIFFPQIALFLRDLARPLRRRLRLAV